MMGYDNYGWNGWMVAMMLAWPILLAVGIWAVVAITRDRRPGTHAAVPAADKPIDILNRRLAAGEITEDEYVRTRQMLKNGEMTEHGAM